MEENKERLGSGEKGVFPGHSPSKNVNNFSETTNKANTNQEPIQGKNLNQTQTYMKLETKNSEDVVSGVLEIDLISFRERGQESRYLSISSIGSNGEGEASNTIMSIDNEADFLKLKNFISNLNWND